MDENRALQLLEKFKTNKLDTDETLEFAVFIHNPDYEHLREVVFDTIWNEDKNLDHVYAGQDWRDETYQKIRAKISSSPDEKPYTIMSAIQKSVHRLIPYAAIVVGVLLVFWAKHYLSQSENKEGHKERSTISPATNKAFIVRESGDSISLSSENHGLIAQGDKLAYDNAEKNGILDFKDGGIEQLTLSTPRAGVYQLDLPDGSRVWLNAGSTIRFPSKFLDTLRQIEVKGEVYIDVKKDASRPFIVITDQQKIKVTGTQFNVNTFLNAESATTTLIEGRIDVECASLRDIDAPIRHILHPGQQLGMNHGKWTKKDVDVSDAIAWKLGKFNFNGKSFKQIMDEISRWYDLDIDYQGPVPSAEFIGDAYRSQSLDLILNLLESTGISYKINVKKRQLIIEYK